MATGVTFTSVKKYFPRLLSEKLAFGFVIAAVIAVFYFEIIIVVPYVHKEVPNLCYVHYVTATFVAINILGNFILMIIVPINSKSVILPSVLKPKWRFCPVCEAVFPPRSFHCNICKKCILRRDHHCTFAGCCVGHKNFRYFWVFLLYLSIGTFYATFLNMFYVWDMLGGLNFLSVASHILPFIFWVAGYLDIKVLFTTTLSVTSVTGFLFVTGLLFFHTRLLLKNQTTYERNHKINYYDLGWKQNIIECLGEKWYLVWLSPFLNSSLPSDGIEFMSRENLSLMSEKSK